MVATVSSHFKEPSGGDCGGICGTLIILLFKVFSRFFLAVLEPAASHENSYFCKVLKAKLFRTKI